VTKARRSPWLNDRATLLVALLAGRGLGVSEDAARQDISDHLDHVAAMMRIGRHAAQMYVTDDVISGMADRIAAAIDEHRDQSIVDQHSDRPVVDLDAERRRRR
jgi:hypothetical protein